MPRTAEQQQTFERSGMFTSDDPLVAFLYLLMRDHLTAGAIARITLEATTRAATEFTNGWLAMYARDIAGRLKRIPPKRHRDGYTCRADEPLPCEQVHLKKLTQAQKAELLLALAGHPLHESVRDHFFLEDVDDAHR